MARRHPPDAGGGAEVPAGAIVDTVRHALLVLNGDLKVRSANRAFYKSFATGPAETEGRTLYELGDGRWDIPRLRELLERVLPHQEAVEDFLVEHDFAALGRRVMLLNARALRTGEGAPGLILLAIEDVTGAKRTEWLLQAEKELAEKALDTIREPFLVLDLGLRVRSANEAFCEAFRVSRAETEGRLVYALGDGQWDIPALRRLLDDVLPHDHAFEGFEVAHEFERIGRRVMLLNGRRIDHLQLILLAFEDVTERRAAERRQETLTAELSHRVKNMLTVVEAIAEQTLAGAASLEEFRAAFAGRLHALSRAHGHLVEQRWEGADLHELAGQALAPYAAPGRQNAEVEGPRVLLGARAGLTLTLVLHELATNAAKYGALSAPEGTVRVEWRLVDGGNDRHVSLRWTERGGPAVRPPSRRGFGTTLIERSVGYELGGEAKIGFAEQGLECEIVFPRDKD